MSSFEQWSSDVRQFCRKWNARLGGTIGRDDFLEFFLTEEWNRFEQEFHLHFSTSTPRWLTQNLNTSVRSGILSSTVALWDLLQSLSTSIDGSASLSPKEYFVSIVDELKNLAERLENIRPLEIHPEEVISIDPEMVEDEASLDLDEETPNDPELDSQRTARTKNPLATPLDPAALAPRLHKPGKKKKNRPVSAAYDAALGQIDPADGPILSLAGRKKTIGIPQVTEGIIHIPPSAHALYDAIVRLARDLGRPGEADVIAYCGRKFDELKPAPNTDAQLVLTQLDNRLGVLANADIQQTATSTRATDLLARTLVRVWRQLLADTPLNHIKLTASEPEVRDSKLGEWREFSLECIPRSRLPGFSKARLECRVHYIPTQFRILLKAQGAIGLPSPFNQNEASCFLELTPETENLAAAWLTTCTALFFKHLALIPE